MNSKPKKIILALLTLSFLLITVGVYFKVSHWPFATLLLASGLVAWAACTILSIYTVVTNRHLSVIVKMLWTFCFFSVGILGILVYVLFSQTEEKLYNELADLKEERSLTI